MKQGPEYIIIDTLIAATDWAVFIGRVILVLVSIPVWIPAMLIYRWCRWDK